MKTAAIGTILPLSTPTLLMDSGASINLLPENLVQFAHLGSAYMEALFDMKDARVGLINNGAEETKGTELYRSAHELLKNEEGIRFVGNIEGRDVPFGRCDVLLCDGFVGNIVLKLSEGFGFYFSGILKQGLMSGLRSKIGALFLKPQLKDLRRKLDYTEYGGAPILGISAPVIKAHGASSPKAIVSAVKMAKRVAESDFFRRVTSVL
jgi:glycerol-3-phosphate acyltransferase PlsX